MHTITWRNWIAGISWRRTAVIFLRRAGSSANGGIDYMAGQAAVGHVANANANGVPPMVFFLPDGLLDSPLASDVIIEQEAWRELSPLEALAYQAD